MTVKERRAYQEWMADIENYEKVKSDLWKKLGEMYVIRGGGERPTCSLSWHYEYLLTCDDDLTRRRATAIWTRYHEVSKHIDARHDLAQAFANIGPSQRG